jgi:hypothetical protein
LKTLSAYGYDVSAVWAEHNAWLLSLDTRAVTDEDRLWATQLPEPSGMADHFVPVRDATGTIVGSEPELLTAARAHVGRQYTLSPGQREVLRDRYGLTPTMVVVAENVELFPTEDVIWSLTLRSVEHVDPVRRRHVLNSVVLSPASAFFRDSAAKDKAREDDKAEKAEASGKAKKPTKVRDIAAEYI